MRYLLFLIPLMALSCSPTRHAATLHQSQADFWKQLRGLCGKAYKGTVVEAPATDTVFRNRELILHFKSCEDNRIRIPFVVGENRSRTFILTREQNSILFKHDHRHEDGSPDRITMYGGRTSNSGSVNFQVFPADQQTVDILPAAAGNVWWFEITEGKYLTYNLRRMGSDRLFTVRFDLSAPVDPPQAPWGWKD